jgi:hypothetical protein
VSFVYGLRIVVGSIVLSGLFWPDMAVSGVLASGIGDVILIGAGVASRSTRGRLGADSALSVVSVVCSGIESCIWISGRLSWGDVSSLAPVWSAGSARSSKSVSELSSVSLAPAPERV